jgi:hypothetical protein
LLIVATKEWTMRKTTKSPGEKIVKDIKRATRTHYSSEEKIRMVLDGLRGEDKRPSSTCANASMRFNSRSPCSYRGLRLIIRVMLTRRVA